MLKNLQKSFDEKIIVDDSSFLNIPCINETPVLILPLAFKDERCGVVVIGDEDISSHIEFYNCIKGYLSLYIVNEVERDEKYFCNC